VKILLETTLVNGENMIVKRCTMCNEKKTLDNFYKGTGAGGKQSRCIECQRLLIGSKKKKFKTTIQLININGEIVESKECSTCKIRKPLTEFDNSNKGLGGKDTRCKDCKRAYYQDNKKHFSKINRQYRELNKVILSEKQKTYYEQNKERITEYKKEYRKLNKEYLYQKNKEYRDSNKQHVLNKKLKWYRANKSRYAEGRKIYYKENPEIILAARHRRRARLQELPSTLTPNEISEINNKFNNGCSLTGCKDNIHLDHVIPLSTGHGGTIFTNMIPLKEELNLSKKDKNIFIWFEENKERFNLHQDKFDSLIEWLSSINQMSVTEYHDYVYWCHENYNTELGK
jgi:hypothetical protein